MNKDNTIDKTPMQELIERLQHIKDSSDDKSDKQQYVKIGISAAINLATELLEKENQWQKLADIKQREETLSYIRDIMERNNMVHPGELFNYWKKKRDKANEIFEGLENPKKL